MEASAGSRLFEGVSKTFDKGYFANRGRSSAPLIHNLDSFRPLGKGPMMIPYGIIIAIGVAICLLAAAVAYLEAKYAKKVRRLEERLEAVEGR